MSSGLLALLVEAKQDKHKKMTIVNYYDTTFYIVMFNLYRFKAIIIVRSCFYLFSLNCPAMDKNHVFVLLFSGYREGQSNFS